MDALAVDFTNNCFRQEFKFDAIICDPPYGVREGLRVLGSKNPEKFAGHEDIIIDGVPAHMRKDYIPPKRPYQFSSLLVDLLNFASGHLKPNGRLCFWMPTANEDMVPNAAPVHPDLELIATCVQPFNKWSRRLLCFRRKDNSSHTELSKDAAEPEEFRDKYFRGFRDQSATPST
jgi:tRNA (guanine10-N2)-methyltransferase